MEPVQSTYLVPSIHSLTAPLPSSRGFTYAITAYQVSGAIRDALHSSTSGIAESGPVLALRIARRMRYGGLSPAPNFRLTGGPYGKPCQACQKIVVPRNGALSAASLNANAL